MTNSRVPSQNETVARLTFGNDVVDLPVIKDMEGNIAIDIRQLRDTLGAIAFDPGYANTGSCASKIAFVDGERGVLRYRGYDASKMAAKKIRFIETAWLLIFGNLPTFDERDRFRKLLTNQELLHEDMKKFFDALPPYGDPMPILSAAIQCSSLYNPELRSFDPKDENAFIITAAKLLSKVRTIAAFAYKKSVGEPIIYPDPELDYCRNFMHMMFSIPNKKYIAPKAVVDALNLFLMLHADHEQNCSTSTVRMVGSSQASLFDSVAAGISALSGPLHGGANLAVVRLFEKIYTKEVTIEDLIESVKTKTPGQPRQRLSGFGHRVYKNYDPRAIILKREVDHLLNEFENKDPLLDIAKELEAAALNDDFFKAHKLYPNVDFYSGILMRAIHIPYNMFSVMFAIARMAGWIAQWREEVLDEGQRIKRPRQVYMGLNERRLPDADPTETTSD